MMDTMQRADKYMFQTYGRFPLTLVRGKGVGYGMKKAGNILILSGASRSAPSGTVPRW